MHRLFAHGNGNNMLGVVETNVASPGAVTLVYNKKIKRRHLWNRMLGVVTVSMINDLLLISKLALRHCVYRIPLTSRQEMAHYDRVSCLYGIDFERNFIQQKRWLNFVVNMNTIHWISSNLI